MATRRCHRCNLVTKLVVNVGIDLAPLLKGAGQNFTHTYRGRSTMAAQTWRNC